MRRDKPDCEHMPRVRFVRPATRGELLTRVRQLIERVIEARQNVQGWDAARTLFASSERHRQETAAWWRLEYNIALDTLVDLLTPVDRP